MTTYGPPGSGQPDDPYQRPATGPDGPPPPDDDPTRQQWGPPPAGAEPPTAPMWGPPPTSGPGYPPPSSGPAYPPPPSSGPAYPPPPGPFPPAGPTPGQPGVAPWGPPAPGGFGMPPAPPVKKNGGKIALIIALVVLLLLCPCLGLAGWAVWKAADTESNAAPAPSVSAPVVPPVLPSDAPTSAAPSPSEDEFAKGDCVVNDGTEDDAELRKVPCGPNTYQVLLRIPATSDGDRCETLAPQATANYVHDNSIDLFDYVLCLKKR